jgi:hypothetical protein
MKALTRLARDSGAAVLLLHHARKSDGQYRDSSAIGAGVDYILEMQPGDEDNVRKITGRGRRAVEDCVIRLEGGRYVLAAGEASLDARVLLFIEANPGCSMRALRDAVVGKAEVIQSIVRTLISSGAVQDRGTGRGMKLHAVRFPAGTAGNRSGTTPEPVPGTTQDGDRFPVPPLRGEPGTITQRGGGSDEEESLAAAFAEAEDAA